MRAASVKPVRCAIYTRVSTDHGLDQEFNSLDAQYDAASAYIKSQAHAGWTLIRSRYDDGGIPAGPPTDPTCELSPCSPCRPFLKSAPYLHPFCEQHLIGLGHRIERGG